jgi:hypothetical protein
MKAPNHCGVPPVRDGLGLFTCPTCRKRFDGWVILPPGERVTTGPPRQDTEEKALAEAKRLSETDPGWSVAPHWLDAR